MKTAAPQNVGLTVECSVAALLAKLADSCGMTIRDTVKYPQLLSDAGLAGVEITEAHIVEAQRIDRWLSENIKARVADYNAAVAKINATRRGVEQPAVEEVEEVRPAKTPRKTTATATEPRKQVKVFGFAATAIIRWMGKVGNWTVEDAAVALNTLGAGYISDTTIRIQLRAGQKGERGPAADITAAMAKKLRKAAE